MASEKTKKDEQTVATTTLAPFKMVWHFVGTIFFVWFLSSIVHIAWVRYYELDPRTYIGAQIDFYASKAANDALATTIAQKAYWLAFEATSFQRKLTEEPPPPELDHNRKFLTRTIHVSLWTLIHKDLQVVAYATILFAIKLTLILLISPLFFILLFAAGVDGLVQRYIRRECGGNESDTLYHKAKSYGTRFLPPLALVIFFCNPYCFDPAWLFVPCVIFAAVMLRIQATYYKKYL